MTTRQNIPIYIGGEDKQIIEKASKIVSLNMSSFCRNSAIMRARKILSEKENDANTTE